VAPPHNVSRVAPARRLTGHDAPHRIAKSPYAARLFLPFFRMDVRR